MNCFTRLGAQNINAKGFFYWMAFHCFYLCTGRKRAQCVLVFFVCEGNCGFPTVFKSVWLRQTLTQCAWGLGWFRFSLMSESKYCWLRHSSSKRGVVEGVQGCWRPQTGPGQRPPLSHFMQCIEDLVLGLFHPCGPRTTYHFVSLPPSLSSPGWKSLIVCVCGVLWLGQWHALWGGLSNSGSSSKHAVPCCRAVCAWRERPWCVVGVLAENSCRRSMMEGIGCCFASQW